VYGYIVEAGASIVSVGFVNYHEGAGNNFLRNIRGYATIYTVS